MKGMRKEDGTTPRAVHPEHAPVPQRPQAPLSTRLKSRRIGRALPPRTLPAVSARGRIETPSCRRAAQL
jgi:hypothetical protein